MRWLCAVAVAVCSVCLLGSGARAESVVEAWRSPYGHPRSVSANPVNHTAWAAVGSRAIRFASDGTVLVQVQDLGSPRAVSVNTADDSCWIANTDANEILHVAADGSELLRIPGVTGPVSVSANPGDGSCWVGANGSVIHLAEDGAVLSQVSPGSSCVAVNTHDNSCWVVGGSGVIHYAASGAQVGAIDLSSFSGTEVVSVDPSDDSVWVGLWYYYVLHLSAEGVEIGRSTGYNSPHAISANADGTGRCWVADPFNKRVWLLDSDGTTLWTGVNFEGPSSLSADPGDGTCWVGDGGEFLNDTAADQVVHVTASGGLLCREGFLARPYAVAVNPTDNSCWVASLGNGFLFHLAEDGSELLRRNVTFDQWAGVAVNPTDGSCYVTAGGYYGVVIRFAANGTELWRRTGFYLPYDISVNPTDGSAWVADTYNNDVVHLSASGNELWRSPSGFAMPEAVCVNPVDGSCWVADTDNHQLVHLDKDGSELWRGDARLTFPNGVAVDPTDGSCWVVADWSRAVVHFAENGTEIWRGGFGGGSVAVDPRDSSVWVADPDGYRVVHADKYGTQMWSGGSFPCPISLSVNPRDGSCWVADPANSQVSHLVLADTLTPTAAFTASVTSGTAPLDVTFTDESTGSPTAWSWSFGDGGASTVQNPSHTYDVGTYTVALTVTNAYGSDTETKVDYIVVSHAGVPLVADFSGAPRRGQVPLPVTFTDQTSDGPNAWFWTFGDGGTTDQQDPAHTYTAAGRYAVSLTVGNGFDTDANTKPAYVTVSFPDIPIDPNDPDPLNPANYWALEEILDCVGAGIVAGYPEGTYRPEVVVTRDQMATFISRALAGGDSGVPTPTPGATARFPDLPTDHWAFKYVEYAYANNIVAGYPEGDYRPLVEVDRGQMAAFIARSIVTPYGEAGLAGYTPPVTPSFPDVATDFWTYRHIEYLREQGMVGGYPDGRYHPEYGCTRDQMAVYITRAFGLTP